MRTGNGRACRGVQRTVPDSGCCGLRRKQGGESESSEENHEPVACPTSLRAPYGAGKPEK